MNIKRVLSTGLTALGLFTASTAFAEPVMVSGHIVSLRTGWNADSFAIVTDTPIANPFGCLAPDGYIVDKSAPGYDTYYQAALLAFQDGFQVQIAFDGARCFVDRPVLIGLNLVR